MSGGASAATIAAYAAVAAAAVGAAGAIVQGQAQADAARARANAEEFNYLSQAQANKFNADMERNNAIAASEQANQKEEANRRRFNMLQGSAYAGIAQSGTGFDGSNLAVLEQNELYSELDSLNIRYEGQAAARGFMARASNETYNAGINKQNAINAVNTGNMTANSAITGSYFNAGSSLLSGASSYYKLK